MDSFFSYIADKYRCGMATHLLPQLHARARLCEPNQAARVPPAAALSPPWVPEATGIARASAA